MVVLNHLLAAFHCAKKPVTTMLTIPLEMYSFTLEPPGKHLETTGADDLTL